MLFKETLTEWFFVEPKTVLLWHRLKNLLSTFIFKSVVCDATYLQVGYNWRFKNRQMKNSL